MSGSVPKKKKAKKHEEPQAPDLTEEWTPWHSWDCFCSGRGGPPCVRRYGGLLSCWLWYSKGEGNFKSKYLLTSQTLFTVSLIDTVSPSFSLAGIAFIPDLGIVFLASKEGELVSLDPQSCNVCICRVNSYSTFQARSDWCNLFWCLCCLLEPWLRSSCTRHLCSNYCHYDTRLWNLIWSSFNTCWRYFFALLPSHALQEPSASGEVVQHTKVDLSKSPVITWREDGDYFAISTWENGK